MYSGAEGSDFDNHILKMTRRTRQAAQTQTHVNGTSHADFIGTGPDHELVLPGEDIVDIAFANVKLATGLASQQNGTWSRGAVPAQFETDGNIGSAGFATDGQISGQSLQTPHGRTLKPFEFSANTDVDLTLESSSNAEWDQFAVNKNKFGVESTYDENVYTTQIDETKVTAQQARKAERIAAEIESKQRGKEVLDNDDGDEEDKYSSVRRDLPQRAAGAYVPPSQRPISGVPTVSGAPFDPAIISSEIKIKAPAGSSAVPPIAAAAAPVAQAPSTNSSVQAAPAMNQADDPIRATLHAFKDFAGSEKLRLAKAQEAQRNNKRQEKNVKLNDLKKFAANFKLKSRVPDDLVPILAKDHDKQVEIQRKAEQAAKEAESRVKDRDADKASSIASPASQPNVATPIPSIQQPPFNAQASRKGVQQQLHGPQLGQGPLPRGPPNGQFPNNRNNWPRPQPLPTNLRMPSGPQPPSTEMPLSPASATSSRALNVKAQEFVFRPAAHTFAPSGPSPSPQHSTSGAGPSPTTASEPVPSFFDSKKTIETVPLSTLYDGIAFLVSNDYTDEQKKKYVSNGGIPQSYQTPPTWNTTDANLNVTHENIYPQVRPASQGPSPMQTPLPNQMQHQMPQHVMPVQAMPVPNQRQQFYPPQGGHMSGYPGPNMHGQFQQHNSAQNSPRMQHMGSFNGQVPPMPPFQNQGVPGYGSPNPGFRQPMQQGMMPHQQGQSKSHAFLQQRQPLTHSKVMRGPPHPGYPGQFGPPQMGGHMMMPNPSAGGYNGPAPGYSPMPHPAQPHMQFPQQQNQGQFGGGSPRGYPMSQQGSQQGYHMPGPHPMQYQRAMSGGYPPNMTPRQQNAMPHHGSPGMGPAQDEGK